MCFAAQDMTSETTGNEPVPAPAGNAVADHVVGVATAIVPLVVAGAAVAREAIRQRGETNREELRQNGETARTALTGELGPKREIEPPATD